MSHCPKPSKTTSQPSTKFLFLCGVGRSGTTIFRRSLGLHSKIYYNGQENNLVQDLFAVALRNCTLPSRKQAMVVDQAKYDRAFRDLTLDLLWPDCDQRRQPILMAAINPTGNLMDYLAQVFDGAKFIGLVRNGIEVVQSRMKYTSFCKDDFRQHCQTWIRTHGVLDWGKVNRNRFRLFRHEWMYDQRLPQHLEHLFGWLGIEADPTVAEQMTQTLAHPTGKLNPEFATISHDDKTAFFENKRNAWYDWTSDQQETFRRVCGELMHELEYSIPGLSD